MSTRPSVPYVLCGVLAGVSRIPAADVRGRFLSTASAAHLANQRLPTDAVGTVKLGISGVKPGSEVHIISADRTLLASNESVGGSVSFTLNRYAAGSANNSIRIVIVHTQYENLDISYELSATDSTIPVFQRIDRNYRNPA